jgi:integrase
VKTDQNRDTGRDTKPVKPSKNQSANLSADGQWESFPNVPNLLRYVGSGAYYGRVKVRGKLIRQSLKTDVFTTAKLRLLDFLKDNAAPKPELGSFAEARETYERNLDLRHDIKDNTKRYYRECVKALRATWPDLDGLPLSKVKQDDCQAWAKRFLEAGYDEQFFNNTLAVLRAIFRAGGMTAQQDPTRTDAADKSKGVRRRGIIPKKLVLPEPAQFERVIAEMKSSGARQSQDCADFARFLAYSGCRLSEAHGVLWSDVNLERGFITVRTAKRRLTGSEIVDRQVPIIPPMRELLTRLAVSPHNPGDAVCKVGECEKSMTRACKVTGVARITHHDLRHLFATVCIESGVDIPTVSRWLGHSDGGALAMKTYGHLRQQHSAVMAQRVTFGSGQTQDSPKSKT